MAILMAIGWATVGLIVAPIAGLMVISMSLRV